MILFIYGENTFLSNQKLKQLRSAFCKKNPNAQSAIENFDASTTWNELHKAFFTFGFLATKRLVVLKNILSENKDATHVDNLLEKYEVLEKSEKSTIIFFEKEMKKLTGEKKKLFEKLKKSKYQFKFEKMNSTQLVSWIKAEVEKKGGRIDNMVANKLAQVEKNNLWKIHNIIDALVAYKDGELIEAKDLDLFITAKVDEDIFKLVDSLVQGQEKKALELINGQLNAGINWNYLIAMIMRQFGIMAMLRGEIDKGGFIQGKDLAKKLSLHPYVVQKSLAQARQYSLEKIRQIHRELISIDSQLKRGGNPNMLLSLLVIKK